MTNLHSLGHRAPLLWVVLPLIGGLVLGRLAGERFPASALLGIALVPAGIAVWAAWSRPRWWAPALIVAMLLAGFASYRLHRARLPVWDQLPPREARLTLRVDRVFAQIEPGRAAGLATVTRSDAHLRDLRGQRVYFSLTLPPGTGPPLRSEMLSTLGVLATLPRDPPRETFDGYLANAGINFRFSRGRVLAVAQPATAYQQFCHAAAARFQRLLSRGVEAKAPEHGAVFRAMLLGQKHELNDEQDSLFMRSGTMHLFAISGLHIGIIAAALHALLSLLRLPAVVRFAVQLAALWLYVDITGATPSAVRAFIMVAVVELSLLLQAPRSPVSALAASALVVLVLWPLQIFSASFQLSYAIVAALLLLGLPLGDAVQARWQPFRDLPRGAWERRHHWVHATYRNVTAAVALGLSSTLVSTLGGVMFFQLFTPGALFANLVLIPAAMVVILAGFTSLVTGLINASFLSTLFNHAAVLVLAAIDRGVRLVVAVPGTWHPAAFSEAWIGPTSLLLLIVTLIIGYQTGWRWARGGWLPPFAVVASTLTFGVQFG